MSSSGSMVSRPGRPGGGEADAFSSTVWGAGGGGGRAGGGDFHRTWHTDTILYHIIVKILSSASILQWNLRIKDTPNKGHSE